MANHGKLAREVLQIIELFRRQGSTTALLEAPAVKEGRAHVLVHDQNMANILKKDCPTVKAVSIHNLMYSLRGKRGPIVVDLGALYVILNDALAATPQGEQTGAKEAPKKVRVIKRTITRTITRTVYKKRVKG